MINQSSQNIRLPANSNTPLRVLLTNNMPTHHQFPLAQNLAQLLGDRFRFACYHPVTPDRQSIGWKDFENRLPWMIRVWESKNENEEYLKWLRESDVVVGYPENWQEIRRERLSKKKLFLLTAEHPLKPSNPLWGFPPPQRSRPWLVHTLSYYRRKWIRIQQWHWMNSPFCHLLAIGAYCPADLLRLGISAERMWTYGYFNDVPATIPQKRSALPVQVLFAGRMLEWKRVDLLIKACRILSQKNLNFQLKLIGDGPEGFALKQLTSSLGLQNVISFFPPVKPEEIRIAMREANIFVLPSSQEEGWGVVIGEAMAEGCTVVASVAAGAAPLLVQHGTTGYLFPHEDIHSLAGYLEELILNPQKATQMGLEGWRYMQCTWNPTVAAKRLLEVSEGLLGRQAMPEYPFGPFSPVQMNQLG